MNKNIRMFNSINAKKPYKWYKRYTQPGRAMLDHYVCDGGQTFVINYSQ